MKNRLLVVNVAVIVFVFLYCSSVYGESRISNQKVDQKKIKMSPDISSPASDPYVSSVLIDEKRFIRTNKKLPGDFEINNNLCLYYPFQSFRLFGLYGERCEMADRIRTEIFIHEFVNRWHFFSGDEGNVDVYYIFDTYLSDVINARNQIVNIRTQTGNAEWETSHTLYTFFSETHLLVARLSAVLSCVVGGSMNFNFNFRVVIPGGLRQMPSCQGQNDRSNAEKILKSMDQILQRLQNILEINITRQLSISNYRIAIFREEFEELCDAIEQECMGGRNASDENDSPPPSVSPDLWDDAPSPDSVSPGPWEGYPVPDSVSPGPWDVPAPKDGISSGSQKSSSLPVKSGLSSDASMQKPSIVIETR